MSKSHSVTIYLKIPLIHNNNIKHSCISQFVRMDDIEERPSKIRKLDNSETLQATTQAPIQTQPLDPVNGESPFQSELTTPNDTPNDNAPQEETPAPVVLSKSALKKLRRKEAWAAGVDDRRARRRDQHKERQARKAILKSELAAKIASGEIEAPPEPPKVYVRPQQVPVGLILDCDFEDKMMEKEIISLGSQLTRCYSDNKGAKFRVHLCVSSWGGALKERFETVLANAHLGWKGVMFEPQNFQDAGKMLHEIMHGENGGKLVGALAEKSEPEENGSQPQGNETAEPRGDAAPASVDVKNTVETTDINTESETNTVPPTISTAPSTPPNIIYLSSDSPTTLTTLSPYTTYIIGGIVDKNRHKNLCYTRAKALGIPTAKLPIGEYMTMQSRTVLTVNHVVEIMLRWLELGDWGEAFERVIPKRKGGVLKGKKGEEGEGDGEEHGDVNGNGNGKKGKVVKAGVMEDLVDGESEVDDGDEESGAKAHGKQ